MAFVTLSSEMSPKLSSAHEIMVLNDVIICFPAVVRESLTFYAHEHSIDWLMAVDKCRDYDLLLSQLKEKEAVIQEKEAVIQELAEACDARLHAINSLAAELQCLKREPNSTRPLDSWLRCPPK